MENKLLTIAIPTYNRVENLKRCVQNLQTAIKTYNLSHSIEILIVDNASTSYNREDLIYFLEEEITVFIKNETNIGGELNFFRCIEESKGLYVWVLGDDDYIYIERLKTVYNLLSDKLSDLIFLNYDLINPENNEILKRNVVALQPAMSKDELIIELNSGLGFISGIIVNKELFLSNISHEEYKFWLHTSFPYLFSIIKILLLPNVRWNLISTSIFQQGGITYSPNLKWYLSSFIAGLSEIITYARNNLGLKFYTYIKLKRRILKDIIAKDFLKRKIDKESLKNYLISVIKNHSLSIDYILLFCIIQMVPSNLLIWLKKRFL